jgi:hypothetical protein
VNLKREQVEAIAEFDGIDLVGDGNILPAIPIAKRLAAQLLATMDTLTTAEARIEAALAYLDGWPDGTYGKGAANSVAAILRGDHDTKGERL